MREPFPDPHPSETPSERWRRGMPPPYIDSSWYAMNSAQVHPTWSGSFMVRGRITTLCQSRGEPGGAKAQRRKISIPCTVFGTALELFPGVRFTNSAGRPHQGTGPLPSLRRALASIAVTCGQSRLASRFSVRACYATPCHAFTLTVICG